MINGNILNKTMKVRFSTVISLFILLTLPDFILSTECFSAQPGKTFGNVKVAGNVFIKSAKSDWTVFKDDFPLLTETDIKTEKGVVSIQFIDGSLVDISKETVVSIKGTPKDYAMQVERGSFAFNIDPAASFIVLTPSAKLSIGGKEQAVQKSASDEVKRYMGVILADGLVTEIKSLSGSIPVTIKGDTKIITPREKIVVDLRGKYGISGVDSNNLFLGSDADYKGFTNEPGISQAVDYVGKVSYLKIGNVKGKATIISKGKKKNLKPDEGILLNDVIETGEGSRVKIAFIDDSLLTLNEFTRLTVKDFSLGKNGKRGKNIFSLEKGQVRSDVGKNELMIHTHSGVTAARGTIIILEVIDGESRLYVIENEATFTFFTPDGLSEIIHNIDEGYMFGDGMTEPIPIPPYKLLDDFISAQLKQCDFCQKLDSLGVCVPDASKDPGPCMKCQDGAEMVDDTEDPGSCKKCQGGQEVVDDSEDPGSCMKCQDGEEVADDTEDPGLCRKCEGGQEVAEDSEDPGPCKKCEGGSEVVDDSEDPGTCSICSGGIPVIDDSEDVGECQKCENGQVVPDTNNPQCLGIECNICEILTLEGECVPDNSRDPGLCQKCVDGRQVSDDTEDPGLCQKCQNGSPVSDDTEDPGMCKKCQNGVSVNDNLEDPGMCKKCQNGVSVNDDLEDPGMCKKCQNGASVNDNLEDPGMCKKCQNGVSVNDDLEDPGMCKKCQNGASVNDNLEDPGMCKKCQNGASVNDNLEDPGMCLKCQSGMPVADNFENPGLCYRCSGGASIVDDFAPCNDNDICTINDRCFGGSCIGSEDPSPVVPECF